MTQAAIHTHTMGTCLPGVGAWAGTGHESFSLPGKALHVTVLFIHYPPSIPKSYWLPCFPPLPFLSFSSKVHFLHPPAGNATATHLH